MMQCIKRAIARLIKIFLKKKLNIITVMKFTAEYPEYSKYKIGRFTYGRPNVWEWTESGFLKIGSFCSIAEGVTILLGGNHRIDWVSTCPFKVIFNEYNYIKRHSTTKGDVVLGNDVWIGHGATILSGVTIGDGAVIGAKTVVTKSVEPYSIVVGNPGRVIRKRFSEEVIRDLLEIKWWDWDIKKIKENIPLICSEDVTQFINKHLERPL